MMSKVTNFQSIKCKEKFIKVIFLLKFPPTFEISTKLPIFTISKKLTVN